MSWFVFWSNVSAFWTTVVIGCLQPVNWEYCWPPHEWLVPAVADIMRAREPYASERKILQSLENDHGLDDRRTKPGAEANP
jgi:hypothetical protein